MNSESVKVSDIYFAGAIAAERALPKDSKAIIERLDAIQTKWIKDGCLFPEPIELADARANLDADPLAHAAMEIRRLGNQVYFEAQLESRDFTAAAVAKGR